MYDHKICMLHQMILHHEQWKKNVLKVVIMKYVYYIMHFHTMNHENRLSKVITLKFYIMKIVTQIF